jgi:predicted ribosomally synthesized peptide with nif11-like leader
MSIQDIKSFVDKAFGDENLGSALQETISSTQSADVPGAIVALGAKNGFTFTEQEAVQARDLLQPSASNDGELTDAQLEMIAGGGWGRDANNWLKQALKPVRDQEFKDFFSGW